MSSRKHRLIPSSHDLIRAFSISLAEEGKRQETLIGYCRDARDFLIYWEQTRQPLTQVDPLTFKEYQRLLGAEKKERSVQRITIGIRQFFRFLHKKGILSHSPLEECSIPPSEFALPMHISEEGFSRLDALCHEEEDSLKRLRDRLMFSLLGWEGLKVSELCTLKWADYVPGSLSIKGAYRKRVISLYEGTEQRIESYLKFLQSSEIWNQKPNMMIGFKGNLKLKPFPLVTRHGIKFTLMTYAQRGRVHVHGQSLRHYAIGFLRNRGFSLAQVVDHLGVKNDSLIKSLW